MAKNKQRPAFEKRRLDREEKRERTRTCREENLLQGSREADQVDLPDRTGE